MVSLAIVQVVGLFILLIGQDSDEEIAMRSATYWDFNEPLMKHMLDNSYDQKIGIFIVTLPTLLNTINKMPFWISYGCLLLGLIFRLPPIRIYLNQIRAKKIKLIYQKFIEEHAEKAKLSD
jgi:hypothetical protein